MKAKISFILIVVLTICLSAVLVVAEGTDDQGNPNDPTNNNRANACYEGGSMEDKCDTNWEWVCGWYIIRLDSGIYSRDEIPAFCDSLLPALPESETINVTVVNRFSGCGQIYWLYGEWINDVLPQGSQLYSDSDCTIPYDILWSDFILAPDAVSALALCQAVNPAYNSVRDYFNSWECRT